MLRKVVDTTARVKFTDALRYFEASADTFRVVGKWRRAGGAFAQCALCEQKMREPLSAASYFIDAAEALRKVEPLEAVGMYGKAIAEYAALGRFLTAAAVQREVAEIFVEEEATYDAATAFGYAADYYAGEALAGPAMVCLLRGGELFVMDERFELAAGFFERAAKLALDDNLLKFNTPAIALDVVLCYLCLRDDERAIDFVEAQAETDFNFSASREKRFALDIVLNCQERDKHAFMDHVWNYDYVHEFAPYQLRVRCRCSTSRCLYGPR